MPKNNAVSKEITPGEAHYVLDRLIGKRRVAPREVAQLVEQMHGEIKELERRLAALRQAAGSSTKEPAGRSLGNKARRPRRHVTPELAKSRRLQGEYMGLIRHLKGQARARIKKLANDQGREAAVRAMRASLTK